MFVIFADVAAHVVFIADIGVLKCLHHVVSKTRPWEDIDPRVMQD
jgi:hypothetical protein